ncbi:hypothetical protein BofuT4_uP101210.1 [Botrytis cinerea T4]|uniref:Uncharacterized protein n=1 Tax=Botryotinia fuckeliana (strain T4) TaxID=999810 RepID=G2YBX6_BOTF4|nr:hypothetical protein BofuT4_uP101210.1 [Botrytis cinerea T4]
MGLDRRMCRPGASIYQYHLASGHSHRRWHIICNLSGVLKHLPMSIAIWVNTVKHLSPRRRPDSWTFEEL